jgi:integrase
MYLKKKDNTWYFQLRVPADLISHFKKKIIFKSLKTHDKKEAQRLAVSFYDDYQAYFDSVRSKKSGSTLVSRALHFRTKIRAQLMTKAEASGLILSYEDGLKLGFTHGGRDFSDLPEKYKEDLRISKHLLTDLRSLTMADALEKYQDFKYKEGNKKDSINKQTLNSKTRRIKLFYDYVSKDYSKLVSDITDENAVDFIEFYINTLDLEPKTKIDFVGDLSSYWRFLTKILAVKKNIFEGLSSIIHLSSRGTSEGLREIWCDDDIIRLLSTLPHYKSKYTKQMLALVFLSMYTGMRSNEICESEWGEIDRNSHIHIPEGKTESSIRNVPIHPILKPLVQKLYERQKDTYLIPGLLRGGDDNKRNHMIGKTFSSYKCNENFPSTVVLHSFRHNFCDILMSNETPEPVAQEIVGHEKQSITYSRYAKAIKIPIMAKSVNKVSYGKKIDDLVCEIIENY